MMILGYLFTYGYLTLLLLTCETLSTNLARKIIHIGVSFCYVIFYIYFKYTFHILIPPITFIIINYISYKKDIFKKMEENKSLGTVYYALSVFIMCLITYNIHDFYPYFGIGLYIMAFADALASIIGKKTKSKKLINNKTVIGSTVMFITSIIVTIIISFIFNLDLNIFKCILIAFSGTILELIGTKGLDNIYVPIGTSIISYLLGVLL